MNERQEIKRLVNLTKLLAVLLLVLIIVEFMSCERSARAAIITGEKPLAGASYYMQKLIEKDGEIFNHEDRDLLAEVMYHENYCNGYEVMLYTGSVVLNRVKHKWFPDTIKGVLYQKGQYATTHKFFTKEIPAEVYDIALHLLLCGSQAPDNVIFQSTHKEFGHGVWKCIKGEYFNYE
ncbi:MAG: cell wall hydrolase [Alphaproteobacteria bacterium]|nr:cell wall hydrolase [Alphaproteobacteria bacterium]